MTEAGGYFYLSAFADGAPEAGDYFPQPAMPNAAPWPSSGCHILASRIQPRYNCARSEFWKGRGK